MHRQALELFEPMLGALGDPLQVSSFRETSAILYPHYARVLARAGKPGEAFLMSERGRGAGLARMARLSRGAFLNALTPAERQKWSAANTGLAHASNHLRVLESQPDHGKSRLMSEALGDFAEANRDLSRIRDQIFAENPKLTAGSHLPSPVLADYLQLARRSSDALFIEWTVVDEKSSLLFVLSAQKGFEYFELSAGTTELGRLVDSWLDAIGGAGGRGVRVARAPSGTQEIELAQQLYRAAFGSAITEIGGGPWTHLVLAADDALYRFPLSALADASGHRLVERYAVTMAVSLRSLLEQRPSSTHLGATLAIADPLRPGEDRVIPPDGLHLEPLPFAREEATEIARLSPHAHLLLGSDVREAQVKKLLGQAGILHFATHGILDPQDGMQSGLVLATEPEDSVEDGILYGWEIASTSLAARLTVLSACETATGNERLGEGLIGLSWAFEGAGCPNVMASLWSVNDRSTSELMVEFYKGWRDGLSIEKALQRAMLKQRAKSADASPFYWAPFELIGPGGTLKQ